ncbi:hypothetical protein KFK09_004541 [Dendrobium nobile]|uniref:Nodulin-related protein 1 n=1 Tax=Dendrobium nobile TaxID=94219 RepID=A0A8T3C0Z2_DENNO|nr:hypothetical protein KFK09_004541 [Dendrobium nobile]
MATDPESTETPTDSIHHKSSSSSDLFSSAKVLADAARSAVSHDGGALDKSKVAEASEDLLDAASDYGKLKEKGYGSYVDKAQGYLHQFHSSDQKPAHPPPPHEGKSTPEEKSTDPVEQSAPAEHKSSGGFGGFGDYVNVAEGFFKK